MLRTLAFEWDSREVRVVVARGKGKSFSLEHVFTVDLNKSEDAGKTEDGGVKEGSVKEGTAKETAAARESDIGKRLATAIAERGIGKANVLAAVGRSSIELRLLTLPPVPDAEMPEMVRFQAMRQFSALGDDWPVDYIPIPAGAPAANDLATKDSAAKESGEEGRSVLAAAISPELVRQIKSTAESAGLIPKRIVLRPAATAALVGRKIASAKQKMLMIVDRLTDEADLTVVDGGTVVYLRTVRLAGEASDQDFALVGEVKRTIVAAQNQLRGRRIEGVVICGRETQQADFTKRLQTDLSLPVEVFDPLAGLAMEPSVARALPADSGRFAPLVGMLLCESDGTPQPIDFLHPRKREAPEGLHRKLRLAAGAAAVVLLGIVYWVWSTLAGYSSEIAELTKKANALSRELPAAEQLIARADKLTKWSGSAVVWLDELRDISLRFPPPDKAMVDKLLGVNLEPKAKRNPTDPIQSGRITLEVQATDLPAFDATRISLGTAHRDAVTGTTKPTGKAQYPLKFSVTSSVGDLNKASTTYREAPPLPVSIGDAPKPAGPSGAASSGAASSGTVPARGSSAGQRGSRGGGR